MIGLEYILELYGMQHIELAEKLGIKKQNINLWIKGKQKIPKRHLPTLERLLFIEARYFPKKLTTLDKLEIQKEKLKRDLQPVIIKYEEQFLIREESDLVEVPVYGKKELNQIEHSIEKAKLIERFQEMLNQSEHQPYLNTFKLMLELLDKAQYKLVFNKTIEGLAHYLDILPDWVSTGSEQNEFESELFKVFNDHNY